MLGRLATIDQYIIEVQPLCSFEYSAFMSCGHIDESQWINSASCCPGCTLYVTLKIYIYSLQTAVYQSISTLDFNCLHSTSEGKCMKGLHVVTLLKYIAKPVGWYIVDNELKALK